MPLQPVATGDPHVPAHNEERESINTLEQQMKEKISLPPGAQVGDLLRWDGERWLTTETRFYEGSGSPNGRVAAPPGSRYVDRFATAGAVEWVKRGGGETNQGWICLAGDTGIRDIRALMRPASGATYHAAYARRFGHHVNIYVDVTMPSTAQTSWQILTGLSGFGPGYTMLGGMQDNYEDAARGTQVSAGCAINLLRTVAGKRDRFVGSWITGYDWPTSLPGSEYSA